MIYNPRYISKFSRYDGDKYRVEILKKGEQPPVNDYGHLFSFFALNNIENISIPGPAWRVPTRDDWQDLINELSTNAGGKLKSTSDWNAPNTGATNSVNFNAIPGGRIDLILEGLGNNAYFWSSTDYPPDPTQVFAYRLDYDSANITEITAPKRQGLSLRMVRAAEGDELLLPNGAFTTGYAENRDLSPLGVIPSVKIGELVWTAINSKETLYNDFTEIPFQQDLTEWVNDLPHYRFYEDFAPIEPDVYINKNSGENPLQINARTSGREAEQIVIGSELSYQIIVKREDGNEFDELFEFDYKDYLLKFYNDQTDQLLWIGYLQPENIYKSIFAPEYSY